ncbi:TetR/AcrR family transcriptional regulator [Enhygromyxa salina]|uniref:Transcriptional regulator BetI n=1 Tax=Enhygromyxa salina TaxID=215803 RepID=A0A2S9YUE2_9BACT|nr:TetR/AcrR family transcriptional regulator [Enhygromyxa salina]PRQ08659.1 transcriptional regulator BetI [Enhygromyxa salina]
MDTQTDQIIEAARTLAESKGVEHLTMNAVARHAGISRATLYRRFASKEALLEQLRADGVELGTPASARQRILEAMQHRVGVQGDLNVTIEDIAQVAGVSVMSVYRSFGDRDALMATFLDQISPREGAGQRIASGKPIEEVLGYIARTAISLAERSPGLLLAAMTDSSAAASLRRLRDSNRSTRKLLSAYFKAASARGQLIEVHPNVLVSYWLAMTLAEPVFLRRLEPDAKIDIDASAKRVVSAFLAAFGATP